jgi:bifunctional non-homologous end joining protein LigD
MGRRIRGTCPVVSSVQPALATLSHERFFEPGWLFERKLDGMRCLAEKRQGAVRLLSRTGRDITGGFPEVADALAQQSAEDFLVDGEIVAFEGNRTSFARLQPRIHAADPASARRRGTAVFLYVFDVLDARGDDVRGRDVRSRKALLRSLLTFDDPVRYTPHRVEADDAYFAQICDRGWEGLIVKRADSTYPRGRTRDWLKFKCEAGQEFVIGGWTDPEGSRVGLGALLIGYHDSGGRLTYAGKVGTGFSAQVLEDLHSRLQTLERSRPAFVRGKLPSRTVHWAEPELVCQVAFTEWTGAGQLRHPRYLGLRVDKAPGDVVRE